MTNCYYIVKDGQGNVIGRYDYRDEAISFAEECFDEDTSVEAVAVELTDDGREEVINAETIWSTTSQELEESQSQEIGDTYSTLSKKYGVDLTELVYGKDGFMKTCYPEGFPDFAGDVIYSEKYWNEFEAWLKETKGIILNDVTTGTVLEGYRQDLWTDVINALSTDLQNGYKEDTTYKFDGQSSISVEQAVDTLGYTDDALERAYSSRGLSGRHVGPAPAFHWISNDNSWRMLLGNVKWALEQAPSTKTEECLKEDTHNKYAKPEGDRVAAFNNALQYAKKDNTAYIYGYTNHEGKFFALDQPMKLQSESAFRQQYKNSKVIYVAYPDKDFITESKDVPIVSCEVTDVITHSEDEKPVDCKGEKKPLEKPLTEEAGPVENPDEWNQMDLFIDDTEIPEDSYYVEDCGFNYDSIKYNADGSITGKATIYGVDLSAEYADDVDFVYFPDKADVKIMNYGETLTVTDIAKAEEILLDNLQTNLTAGEVNECKEALEDITEEDDLTDEELAEAIWDARNNKSLTEDLIEDDKEYLIDDIIIPLGSKIANGKITSLKEIRDTYNQPTLYAAITSMFVRVCINLKLKNEITDKAWILFNKGIIWGFEYNGKRFVFVSTENTFDVYVKDLSAGGKYKHVIHSDHSHCTNKQDIESILK